MYQRVCYTDLIDWILFELHVAITDVTWEISIFLRMAAWALEYDKHILQMT